VIYIGLCAESHGFVDQLVLADHVTLEGELQFIGP
jgi:hypothetical protein